jgi:hypothetical protein
MALLYNIKNTLGEIMLKSQFKSVARSPQVFNLEDCKTVGMIFEAGNPEDFELIKKYVLYLREMKKKVKVIGYYNSKEIPSLAYSKLEYDFFSWKELNWYNKPDNDFIRYFIEEPYDVLIDLNINNHFPLKYIAAMSNAKFKVGKYSDGNKAIYDLLIHAEEGKSFKYFLRQIDTYLQMINKNEPTVTATP